VKKLILAFVACGALCAGNSAAEATTMVATWTGTIGAFSQDTTNVFGLGSVPGAIVGQSFSLTTTFDTAGGTRSTSPGFDKLTGGGTAILTINSHSVSFSGNDAIDTYDLARSSTAPGGLSEFNQKVTDQTSDFNFLAVDVYSTNGNGGLVSSITTPIALMSLCGAGYTCTGNFSIADFSPTFQSASGYFDFSHGTLQVSALAATPIPATLPLFVSALGGIGLIGWRRKRAA
jgi:hypothetical protein